MGARCKLVPLGAVCGAALLLLAGCGGGDEPRTTEPTSSASGAPGPSATPTPTPSAAAATGPLLKMDVAQVNMPEGWVKVDQFVPLAETGRDPDGFGNITLTARDSFGGSIDELAKLSAAGGGRKGEVRRLPDTELAGIPVYHLVGKPSAPSYKNFTLEEFGAVYDDTVVTLILNLERGLPEAELARIRDEVVASFTWK